MDASRKQQIDSLLTKFKSEIIEIVEREDDRNRQEEFHRIQELEKKNSVLLQALNDIAGLSKSANVSRAVQLAKETLAKYYTTSWSPEPSESADDCVSTYESHPVVVKSEVEEAGYIINIDEQQQPESDCFSNSASNSNHQDSDLMLPDFSLDAAEVHENGILLEEPAAETQETEAAAQQKKKRQQTLTYPCLLPPLTNNLLKAQQEGRLLESRKAFLKHFIDYFSAAVSEPTKKDYEVFTRTVVDTYPVFRNTGPSGYYWSTFREKFLASLHNRRSYQRARDVRRAKAMLKYTIKRNKMKMGDTVEPAGAVAEPVEVVPDIEETLRCFSSDDIVGWKQLLVLNFAVRRANIKKLLSPKLRLYSYSYFRNKQALLAEFDLASQGSLATFEVKFKALLAACSVLCDNCTDVSQLVDLMTDKLANNRLKRTGFPCFLEKEVGEELVDTIPEDAPPFVVVYKKGDVYFECCVAAFGQVLLTVKEVQLWEAFLYVIASYYVFGFDYPKTYIFLNLVDEFTIQRSEKDRRSFSMAQNWKYVKVSASLAEIVAKRNLHEQ